MVITKRKRGSIRPLLLLAFIFTAVVLVGAFFANATDKTQTVVAVFYGDNGFGSDEIFLLTPQGSEHIGYGRRPAVSPDGQYLAYTSGPSDNSTIVVRNLDTGEVDPGFATIFNDLAELGVRTWAPYWSPNSQMLAVYAVPPGFDHLVTLRISRNGWLFVTDQAYRPRGWFDNNQIIVDDALMVEENERISMYLVDLRTVEIQYQKLTDVGYNSFGDIAIGPLGVLYEDYSEDYSGGIWIVNPGSQPAMLIPSGRDPVWSPDGRSFAFALSTDGEHPTSGGVWILDYAGQGQPHRVYLTDHPDAYHYDIQWAGEQLYFVTGASYSYNSEGIEEVMMSINIDGTNPQVFYNAALAEDSLMEFVVGN